MRAKEKSEKTLEGDKKEVILEGAVATEESRI